MAITRLLLMNELNLDLAKDDDEVALCLDNIGPDLLVLDMIGPRAAQRLGDKTIPRGVIPRSEWDTLREAFNVVDPYMALSRAREVARRNAQSFLNNADIGNVTERYENVRLGRDTAENITIDANASIHNFAASLSTFKDVAFAWMSNSEADRKMLAKSCRVLKEQYVVFGIWLKLRNYIVHRSMPYIGIASTQDARYCVACKRDELMRWKNWTSGERACIESLAENIDWTLSVQDVLNCVNGLYDCAVQIKSLDIRFACELYRSTCAQYGVKGTILTMEKNLCSSDDGDATGYILPLRELAQACEDLGRSDQSSLSNANPKDVTLVLRKKSS